MDMRNKREAAKMLSDDANKIYHLIRLQNQKLSLSACRLFQEVVDTQLYGFSREVNYAVRLQIITAEQGQQLLNDLETAVNRVENGTENADLIVFNSEPNMKK